MPWTQVVIGGELPLFMFADGDALTAIRFREEDFPESERSDGDVVLLQAKEELEQYWQGRRRVFSVNYEADGTPFQCEVWKALTEIPFGEVRSYAEIAKVIGKEKAVRAVGAANGANPIPIIIPCHRVLTSDGTLGGYGGGLDVKRALLAREGILL